MAEYEALPTGAEAPCWMCDTLDQSWALRTETRCVECGQHCHLKLGERALDNWHCENCYRARKRKRAALLAAHRDQGAQQ